MSHKTLILWIIFRHCLPEPLSRSDARTDNMESTHVMLLAMTGTSDRLSLIARLLSRRQWRCRYDSFRCSITINLPLCPQTSNYDKCFTLVLIFALVGTHHPRSRGRPTLLIVSLEPTCSRVSADGRLRGFLMRDTLTKLWKATDLQIEEVYRQSVSNMRRRRTDRKKKKRTTWFYLLVLVAESCSWTSTSVLWRQMRQ